MLLIGDGFILDIDFGYTLETQARNNTIIVNLVIYIH
jgi:hypothetical protein